jgi:dynein light intermediate chain
MRVRDELKMTIASYYTLYFSSIKFGKKKQLESEDGMEEIEAIVKQYEQKRDELLNLVRFFVNTR